jgi:hypothetical protein
MRSVVSGAREAIEAGEYEAFSRAVLGGSLPWTAVARAAGGLPSLSRMKGVVAHRPACRHCGATLEHSLSKCPKCGRRSLLSLLLPRGRRS